MQKKKIYIACPITLGDQDYNFHSACAIQEQLMRAGYAVLNPALTMSHPRAEAIPHESWMSSDLPWVGEADAIFRMPGNSQGADEEVRAASVMGIPVFYDVASLIRQLPPLEDTPQPLHVPVIGLCGLAGSGKDYLAKALLDRNWIRFAFADDVRTMLQRLDPTVNAGESLSDLLADAGGWMDLKVKEPLIYAEDIRPLLQRLGTECIRTIDPDFWVKATSLRLEEHLAHDAIPRDGIVFTDVRFANEADWIRSLGGYVIKITRPGIQQMDHASERLGFDWDDEFRNEGDNAREPFVKVVESIVGQQCWQFEATVEVSQ